MDTSRMPLVRTHPQLGWPLLATAALLLTVALTALATLPSDRADITIGQFVAVLAGIPAAFIIWHLLKPQGWTYAFGYQHD